MPRFYNRIVAERSSFGCEDNGVWQLIDATGDGYPDLAFIKTKNTGHGLVEVFIKGASTQYKGDLYAINTTFPEEDGGVYLLAPSKTGGLPDLVYIKTDRTPSGCVEVHIASGASLYKTRTYDIVKIFPNQDHHSGFWSVYDYSGDGSLDVVYIKTKNPDSNRVEVYVALGKSNYTQMFKSSSDFGSNDKEGFWSFAPYSSPRAADLVWIKNDNTGTKQVEVHVATQSSSYHERSYEGGSSFGQQQPNGVWSLIACAPNGVVDLAYIKTQDTGGIVEVHVASGLP
ncbi:hypothetical protein E0Z10_g7393 [Xylaria hypoxylon]|uniref:Uncharacterized protein n=1 Tax=Xylaria hypoxylon TaxID=37992 RepID=A0A4Z0YQR3_9PEZI|nr:hypothetical protein E0Z10_g7393 [Xylaria hypoxylon]